MPKCPSPPNHPLFFHLHLSLPPLKLLSRAPPPLRLYLSSNSTQSPEEDEYEEPGAELRYSALLRRCARAIDLRLGAAFHGHLLKRSVLSNSLFLHNHLLNMYMDSARGDPSLALQLFDEMPHRNVVSWSIAISGLVRCDRAHSAIHLFIRMLREGVRPNEFTLVSALNASSFLAASNRAGARDLYGQVIRLGFESNIFLVNAFITAQIRSGRFGGAKELFEKCENRDVVSWNSMIAGFLRYSCSEVWGFWCRMIREGVGPDEFSFSSVLTGLAASMSLRSGVQVHAQLVKYGIGDDICAGNSLADMYLKNKHLDDAFRAFEEMSERDVVSWTEMAAGFLHCGLAAKALEVVNQMKWCGIRPNKFTLATEINACSNLTNLTGGKKAHGYRIKLREHMDECVDNALIDMYANCGSMECAEAVFRSMKERSVITWTTMIMAFAQNGLAHEALKAFDEMISESMTPNYITFICVLYACSQGGFIDEGWRWFDSMARDYGIEPGEDHYACMVDLLGRAGHIEKAEEFISSMPFRPGVLVWQTLLASCRRHGDVEAGKRAAERALALEKEDPSTYVLLSNMFADTRNWGGVRRVRELMEDREVKRFPGSSWIQVVMDSSDPLRLEQRASA
ncbi:putative pentatricopeptide repeat-containing protein [Ananas comosus]|uniref:Putative pentatricopeptide repeat-containing protein n=1 Tax=Ananas comosus TaxID=4615 RepID=A0A199VDN0_ANACO|nr:putative pentatricopeptide repeat-containing protein [Ananas comosus]